MVKESPQTYLNVQTKHKMSLQTIHKIIHKDLGKNKRIKHGFGTHVGRSGLKLI